MRGFQAALHGLLFALKADALHMHIHVDHMQPGHGFDGLAHVFLHVGGNLLDGRAVFDDDVQLYAGFLAAYLYLYAPGDVAVAADDIGNAAAGAHTGNAVNFAGGHAGDDGDNFVGIFDGAAVFQIDVHIRGQIVLLCGHGMHLLYDVQIIIAENTRFGNWY